MYDSIALFWLYNVPLFASVLNTPLKFAMSTFILPIIVHSDGRILWLILNFKLRVGVT
jgi:hypothetical protein